MVRHTHTRAHTHSPIHIGAATAHPRWDLQPFHLSRHHIHCEDVVNPPDPKCFVHAFFVSSNAVQYLLTRMSTSGHLLRSIPFPVFLYVHEWGPVCEFNYRIRIGNAY